jgi:site-specific DNA recombinase
VNFLKKKNAICYYRVSSKQQAEKQSIDLQKHNLKEFAEEKGYDIMDEFKDDGIPGESIKSRPGFQKTLTTIEEGGVDVLLVYMIDRIGRFAVRKDRNYVIELLEDSHTDVDSPYDGLFRWDNEKELNDLEGALNESRLDNKRRAKRISEGHKAVRINGGFSGGHVPYGVRYDKETKKFYKNPKEVATLKVIFSKLRGGLGIHRTAKFLSQDLTKYPLPKMKRTYRKDNPVLGVKRGDSKPADAWNAATVRSFAHRDFYFTGIIKPSPAAAKKGLPQVDTKIRLFTEEEVKAAREEMRIRRWTTKRGKYTIKTDMLCLGFVRCAYCGWKLGPYYAEYKNGKPKRISYRCRGMDSRRSTGCKFKKVRAKVLDNLLWNAFIKLAEDPKELEKRILKEEFIVDKDRADLEAMKDQAKGNLDDYEAKIRRFNWLVLQEEMPKDQYLELVRDIKINRQKAEEQLEKANAALRRPRDIKYAAKRASEILAEQMNLLSTLHQVLEVWDKSAGFENLKKWPNKLWAMDECIKLCDSLLEILNGLKDEATITQEDFENKEISQFMYQQKRIIFQQYLDPERGIEVWNKDKFEIHLSIPKMANDDLGSKKIKSLKHLKRPALPPARD